MVGGFLRHLRAGDVAHIMMRALLLFTLLLWVGHVSGQAYPQGYFRNPLAIPVLLAGNFGAGIRRLSGWEVTLFEQPETYRTYVFDEHRPPSMHILTIRAVDEAGSKTLKRFSFVQ